MSTRDDHEVYSDDKDITKIEKTGQRRLIGWLAGICWYLLGLWVVFALINRVVTPAWQTAAAGIAGWATKVQDLLGLLLIAVAFVLVHLGWLAAWRSANSQVKVYPLSSSGLRFPAAPTFQIGIGILSFAALSLLAVVVMLHFGVTTDVHQIILMTCSSGVGSSIATILGFLEHVSEKKDFDPAYAPWYVGRPAMGLLLGLLFFLLIRGGMLGVLPNLDAGKLNPYGLAAIGGMVGLFTKDAVKKLQEVFDVLFQTKNDTRKELLSKLPPELKKEVENHLAPKE